MADLRSLDLLPGAGLQQEQIVSAFLALAGFNLDFLYRKPLFRHGGRYSYASIASLPTFESCPDAPKYVAIFSELTARSADRPS